MSDIPPALLQKIERLENNDAKQDRAIALLQQTTLTMQADMRDIRAASAASDAKRDEQTRYLGEKIDDIRDRALTAWPVGATMTVTVLSVIAAALVTAFFTR